MDTKCIKCNHHKKCNICEDCYDDALDEMRVQEELRDLD